MSENKGKPSGKYAEEKTSPGRKGNYQRTGWPANGVKPETNAAKPRSRATES
jgi:hypothetical protein